jgi:PKD repeat protein
VYNEIGTYDVILVVTDGNDSQTVVKTSYISSLEGINTTVAEDFEDGGIPSGWILNGNGSWTVAETSAYNTGDYCMKFDNYYYDAQGARDEIWLGKTQYSSPVLEFDVAYAQYNDETYTDTLAVLYSVDCGATWTEIFVAGGDDLATAPDNTGYFMPDAAQWEERTIVTGPLPFGDIIFSFQNRGHYGNVIYVDNINISPAVRVDELEEVLQWSVYPNPAHDVVNVSVRSLQSGDGSIRIFDGTGKLLDAMAVYHSGGRLEKQFDFSHYTSGIYWMQLTDSSGRSESKKIEIRH